MDLPEFIKIDETHNTKMSMLLFCATNTHICFLEDFIQYNSYVFLLIRMVILFASGNSRESFFVIKYSPIIKKVIDSAF